MAVRAEMQARASVEVNTGENIFGEFNRTKWRGRLRKECVEVQQKALSSGSLRNALE